MAKKPRFSILIPTRERDDTLHYAIRSVVEQSFTDFELVISDNLSSPRTKECVDKFNDPRIIYRRTTERLAMSDNWEFGLRFCSGEYVFILGDDDALIPGALAEADGLLKPMPGTILSWHRPGYFWPSAILKSSVNQLELPLGNGRVELKSKEVLSNVYRFALTYYYLPMIYSSFIPSELIEKVRGLNNGKYFYGRAPDICSGVINALFTDNYIHSQIPLSVAGVSGHSTGLAQGYQSLGSDAHKRLLAEGNENAERPKLHPALVDSTHQYFLIADDLLKLKDRFFKDTPECKFEPENFLKWTIGSLWADYDMYDEFANDMIAFAAKYDIDTSTLRVPKKIRPSVKLPCVATRNPNDLLRDCYHTIDCAKFGIENVWDAAILLEKLLPDYANGVGEGWRGIPPQNETVIITAEKNFSRDELLAVILSSNIDNIEKTFNDENFQRSYLAQMGVIDRHKTVEAEGTKEVERLSLMLEGKNAVAGLMGLMLLYPPEDLRVDDLSQIPEWFKGVYQNFAGIQPPPPPAAVKREDQSGAALGILGG